MGGRYSYRRCTAKKQKQAIQDTINAPGYLASISDDLKTIIIAFNDHNKTEYIADFERNGCDHTQFM